MRRFLIISALLVSTLALVFSFLPFGTLAVIPAIVGAGLGFFALKKSPDGRKKVLPKIFIGLSCAAVLIAFGKNAFSKDEVALDDQYEERIEESQEKAIEELEEIQSDLEDLELDEELEITEEPDSI